MILGINIERTGHRTAHIRPVTIALHEGDPFPLVKNRADDAHIIEMGASPVRIIHQEYITRVNIITKILNNGLRRQVQGSHMNGDVLRTLHHRVSFRIAQGGTEIPIVDHEGVTGSPNLLGHLVDQVDKSVF